MPVCVVIIWPASPFLHSLPCCEGSGGGKLIEMWWWWWIENNVLGGKKTRQTWWWRENKANVVKVVVKEKEIEMWDDFIYFK